MSNPPSPASLRPATGKLGILLPGMGAVATTFIAGVLAVRKGLALPIGSLTQMGSIRLGQRTEHRNPFLRDFVPLSAVQDLVFGGWDIYEDNCYQAARKAGVLSPDLLESVREDLEAIRPMPAVFDPGFVSRISGPNVKPSTSKRALVEALMEDMRQFKQREGCDRLVMIWCGSTERYLPPGAVHESLEALERAIDQDHPDLPPGMLYAYAALRLGIPYANGAPNLSCDVPALVELARKTGAPLAGKDFKTGQTLMKTIVAPGLKARSLGISGWFSTNILGNRDGEVLDDPDNFRSKEVSKLGVLEQILEPERHPELYGELYHKVRIEYYPPRGDNKEGWDNIDITGWLGYPMQIKIDFLCRDSILAAPLVLDLALFLDLAARAGMSGVQEWLSFYFKSPQTAPGLYAQHDVFIQREKLMNTLRHLMGETLITHLGLEYYSDEPAQNA
ncbi:MAG: inositol-3-phosphate synthase [Bacteroidetes bacterium]|nr:inositol-3-phosphate synthase [Bacteroidota bacterium]